ncbi:hypothetical protein KJ903_05055, partial [Patescibacteria group bacterium]|nr:hypothetical protein [Patescibacteria group bacterium]
RIDGEIYRTEVGGDNPLKLADTIRPQTNNTYDLGTSTYNFKNGYFAGTVATSGLTGTGIVTSTNILDGTIAAADLADSAVTTAKIADSAVTSAKIVDGTIATADLVDDSVTPAKINGTGGANLPIAYGSVASDGTITAATSNITVTWQAGGQYYEITIDGENYISQEYVTVVTPISNNYFGMVSHGNGKLDIDFMDDGGTSGQQTGFQFVTYKP